LWFDRALEQFPPPAHTGYDGTNALRCAFLNGDAKGVDFTRKTRGKYVGTMSLWASNEVHAAFGHGAKEGQYAVLQKILRLEWQSRGDIFKSVFGHSMGENPFLDSEHHP
jgi:hypothetical protein